MQHSLQSGGSPDAHSGAAHVLRTAPLAASAGLSGCAYACVTQLAEEHVLSDSEASRAELEAGSAAHMCLRQSQRAWLPHARRAEATNEFRSHEHDIHGAGAESERTRGRVDRSGAAAAERTSAAQHHAHVDLENSERQTQHERVRGAAQQAGEPGRAGQRTAPDASTPHDHRSPSAPVEAQQPTPASETRARPREPAQMHNRPVPAQPEAAIAAPDEPHPHLGLPHERVKPPPKAQPRATAASSPRQPAARPTPAAEPVAPAPAGKPPAAAQTAHSGAQTAGSEEEAPVTPSKLEAAMQHDDERTNYANRKDGAKVLAANPCAPSQSMSRHVRGCTSTHRRQPQTC